MSFDALRTHLLNRQKNAKKNSNRTGIPPWLLKNFEVHIGDEVMVRVLKVGGDGTPFVRKWHWPAKCPQCTCTAEIPEFGGKCVYCHYDGEHRAAEQRKFEEEKAKGRKYQRTGSRLGQKSSTEMEVIEFRYHHVVPGEKPDEKEYLLCNVTGPDGDPERCDACAADDESIRARVFNGNRIWSLKDDHLSQLLQAHQRLKKVCVHENADGTICNKEAYIVALTCPSCQADLVDPDRIRRMSSKDLEVELKKERTCEGCGQSVFPDSTSACKSGEHEAVPGTIFDKDIWVIVGGEEKDKNDGTGTYEELDFSFDLQKEPFQPVATTLDMWGFSPEEAEQICAPRNFVDEFRPEFIDPSKYKSTDEYVAAVLDKQAERIKVKNPWETSRPASGFRQGGSGGRSFTRRS